MKLVKVIFEIILLYIIYLAGVWIQDTFQLVIPGSMIGMFILLLLLLTKIVRFEWIEAGASLLLAYLPLLFLPVTVGIITFLDLFKGEGLFILLIVIVSTTIVLVFSAISSQWLIKRRYENE